jgi:hypothetical protein
LFKLQAQHFFANGKWKYPALDFWLCYALTFPLQKV